MTRLFNRFHSRRQFLSWSWRALVVVSSLAALGWLMRMVGASHHFLLAHVFYLPVLLAAFCLGRVEAAVVGVAAGIVAGPSFPHEARAGHVEYEWAYHLVFFVGFGWLSGWFVDRYRARSVSVRRLYARTLRGFLRALEYKDEETSEHCERVARNAMLLGHRLGLSERALEALYWSGYLHDLGKIATPAQILAKPCALSSEEYEVVKRHTVIGGDLLVEVSPAFERIAEGVRYHHEQWDGRGYPEGLAGTDIPLFGRILHVVDVFEALTSDRPYRAAVPEDEAAAIMRDGVGTKFEPRVAEAFQALLAEDRIHVEGRHGRRVAGGTPDTFNPDAVDRRRWWGLLRPGIGT